MCGHFPCSGNTAVSEAENNFIFIFFSQIPTVQKDSRQSREHRNYAIPLGVPESPACAGKVGRKQVAGTQGYRGTTLQ